MKQSLQLIFLGAPRLTLAEQALNELLTPKALALFAYLAVTGQSHTRDWLAHLLWSEMNNQQARNNLRYTLSDLRPVMGDYLTITPQTIGFNRQAPYWLDVEILRNTLASKALVTTIQALQAPLALYQDEFLAGFTVRNAPVFAEWVMQQRAGLQALALQGFYMLAEHYHQAGDFPAALATTQRLLQWEPLHEAGHRLHLHFLVAVGQRTAALTQHRLFQQTLADELGVEPEAATTALYEQIRRGAYDKVADDKVTGDKVPSASPVTLSPPHNLPSQLTPFFGRETEIEQICDLLLSERYRLVTLTGEGGIGKTRLALAVAQAILDFRFWIFDSVEPSPSDDQNQKSKIKSSRMASGGLGWPTSPPQGRARSNWRQRSLRLSASALAARNRCSRSCWHNCAPRHSCSCMTMPNTCCPDWLTLYLCFFRSVRRSRC